MKISGERSIQYTLVDWLQWKHPTILFQANVAEQKATVSWHNIKKSMGFRKGVSDLFFPQTSRLADHYNDSWYKGLWLELKTIKGKASREQVEFINDMIQCDYAAFITHGYEEAHEKICWFFNLKD